MRLFLDECLSPNSAKELAKVYEYHVVHPLSHGGMRSPDHNVVARCINEDLVIVTENASDFTRLLNREEVHPGLIILPNINRNMSKALLLFAIDFLLVRGNPMDQIMNHILKISKDGKPSLRELSSLHH